MNVLIGFEESQTECIAFRDRGFNAFSNDLLHCTGFHPEWHIQGDFFEAVSLKKWDLIIIHPPCTYTCLSGNAWYWNSPKRIEGAFITKTAWEAAQDHCDYCALEQPKTIMQKYIGPKSQVIQPWQYGHGETKETWLWLKNLPRLIPTNIVDGRENRILKMGRTVNRAELRSKSYPGIARAMAEQWGNYITKKN